MSIPPCGLGHDNGPLLGNEDLEPLDGLYSMTIAKTSDVIGWSRSRIYRFLDGGQLRSFRVGKQRLIIVQSLRQLLAELAARPEGALPLPPRRPGGRFAPSPKENDENAGVRRQRVKEFST